MKKEFNPGDVIWVVIRDENGAPFDVSEQVFLARLKDVAITAMNIGWDIDAIVEVLLESTRFNADTDVKAYLSSDCYCTEKDASKALENELRKIRDENFVDLEDDEIKI